MNIDQQSNKIIIDLICLECGMLFKPLRVKNKRKYCNRICFGKATSKNQKKTIKLTCEWCQTQFERIPFYSYQKCCSSKCAKEFRRKGNPAFTMHTCSWCKVEFKVSYKFRNTGKYCSASCRSSDGWNLGETAETNEVLRLVGEKGSVTKSQQIIDGTLKIVVRSKCSKISSKKAISEKSPTGLCYCRSPYEHRFIEILDKDPSVLSFVCEPFRIPYEFGTRRNYVPDFLVTYSDGFKKVIEVKPAGLVNDPQNIAKAIAATKYCLENSMMYQIVTENDLFVPGELSKIIKQNKLKKQHDQKSLT